MAQYIDKSALVAEIERQISAIDNCPKITVTQISVLEGDKVVLTKLLSFIDTLEVKESKLPNPRFPHLNNIVDKVFGAGNLESWEYEEAEQLVLLAKEELLKDLEVKEVDLEEKATQLSQKYFPDEDNIWARANIEAQNCKSACIEMVEWFKAQKGE